MRHTLLFIAAALLLIPAFISCSNDRTDPTQPAVSSNLLSPSGRHHDEPDTASVTVFATGLENPRGLKFGPDGFLYVAEGGTGGTNSTVGECDQVIPPVGPYTGSPTGGRISRIDSKGNRTTVTDQLPSSQTSPMLGSLVSGVADVAFIGDDLYALLAGAGCSHGVPDVPNGVVLVNSDGSWKLIADLSAYQKSHPVAHPEEEDFEPDGTWYSMISLRGMLYAVEPNHGELVQINPMDGNVRRIADISASQGHIVPTALAYRGNFLVGNLNTFPIVDGSSKILKVAPGGRVATYATGFTTVLGLAFDRRNRLYILENTTGNNPNPTPGTGMIVRLDQRGRVETIASHLSLPTGMTFGPDGNIYVSNWGFGPPDMGQVVRVNLRNAHGMHDDDMEAAATAAGDLP